MPGKIVLYTAIHFFVACVTWFLLLGVALGLGFKEQWTAVDHVFAFVTQCFAYILTFPIWLLAEGARPAWPLYILLPLQVVVSFVQVNLVLVLCHRCRRSEPEG